MEDWKFLRRKFIQEMYVGLILNSLSVFSMKSKEMLSKALKKSIWSMRPGRLCVLACWKRSKVFLVTSPINIFGRYAFCQGDMILSKMGLSLEVKTPEAIFWNVGRRVMGLRLVMCVGSLSCLGIRVTRPTFCLGGGKSCH